MSDCIACPQCDKADQIQKVTKVTCYTNVTVKEDKIISGEDSLEISWESEVSVYDEAGNRTMYCKGCNVEFYIDPTIEIASEE